MYHFTCFQTCPNVRSVIVYVHKQKKQSDKNNFPIQTRIKQKMQKKILCFTLWDIKTTVWDTYFTL